MNGSQSLSCDQSILAPPDQPIVLEGGRGQKEVAQDVAAVAPVAPVAAVAVVVAVTVA